MSVAVVMHSLTWLTCMVDMVDMVTPKVFNWDRNSSQSELIV